MTPPNYKGNSVKIVLSAASNAVQILGHSVSLPNYHVHDISKRGGVLFTYYNYSILFV